MTDTLPPQITPERITQLRAQIPDVLSGMQWGRIGQCLQAMQHKYATDNGFKKATGNMAQEMASRLLNDLLDVATKDPNIRRCATECGLFRAELSPEGIEADDRWHLFIWFTPDSSSTEAL